MVRNRLLLVVQGLLILGFLTIGVYILSLFQNYSTEAFREKCIWKIKYADTIITQNYPERLEAEALEDIVWQVGEELNLDLQLIRNEAPAIGAEEVWQARKGILAAAVRNNPRTQEKTLYVAMPLKEEIGVLQSQTSLREVQLEYQKVRMAILLGLLAMIIFTSVLAQQIVRKIMRPLKDITGVAGRMSRGDLGARVIWQGNDEFAILAHTLNNLAERLNTKLKDELSEKRKLELIMDNMDNGVVIVDKSLVITTSNQKFRENFGEAPEEKYLPEVVTNTALDSLIKFCLTTNEAKTINLSVPGGAVQKYFQVFAAPIMAAFQEEPTKVLLVFHDITALQAIYDKQAEFVSNASHELATPLTTIKGFSEVLLDDEVAAEAESRRKFVKIIFEESERMQALVKDLLQLAKLDSEEYKKNIKIENFIATSILEGVQRELAPQAEQRELTLVTKYDCQPRELAANRDWLKQVIVNLTENALKYTSPGGTITLGYSEEGALAVFTVHNTGEGISEEDKKRIFDRFYRIDKARTRQAGGTGLGLSIVKFIVEMFGGTINVTSSPNQGTAFVFTIPLAKD